jgi:uncharacterized glyoxalase superfamily protein PhnB
MRVATQAYLKNSVEAVAFYQKAFGATLGYNERNPDNTFMHAELNVKDQPVLWLSESTAAAAPGNTMQFCVMFGSENVEAVKHAYQVLSEEGQILYPLGPSPWSECMADIIDKFGIHWYISV